MRAKSSVLLDRLVAFSVSALVVAKRLNRDATERHIADQLSRCATSAAANYAEACEAESRRDFIHKMKIGLKELRECEVWLRTIAALAPSSAHRALAGECGELIAIFVASIQTAKSS